MSMGVPTVTCVIIVYNGEAYLDEAIESVIQQSSPDWELIIADDGSSDGSREIARRHAAADSRIRLISRENKGLRAANVKISQ